MTKITRFSGRDPGASARVSGFVGHLRDHGFPLGVRETEAALESLGHVAAADPFEVCLALKAVCSGNHEDFDKFDILFDSYWRNQGRVRNKIVKTNKSAAPKYSRTSQEDSTQQTNAAGNISSPDTGGGLGEVASEGEGRLVASGVQNLMKKDLRELLSPQDIAAAEVVARRLADAIRDRRSRRRHAAIKGDQIDFRKVVRKSLSTGGEPIRLPRRRRPERPVHLVALCDVSGSMTVYARLFLAFLSGLIRADATADAYLFHTRLVRITQALRDDDPLRSLNRLTLLADGFGGGSKIGATFDQFGKTYARRFVSGRSVVLILSDGYDTDAPELLGSALKVIKKRGCKIIWLNPLKGWKGYEPVARGMAAALPYLDMFAAANTLESLAALEPELAGI
ncbi:VWA domain-containing protein [Pseudohalocynthiibacter aestuariivivens]|jgi:uncharacterized protein|uniref:VWA domain-containing protein n=1 Tax=Pseudohalocynthiibacter aestuariivivens TaxID=1591409 RepID=A0ABV5JB20_9RHOB|nr:MULTISPECIES: VWA domain-containing protein [Pseudohalocynthiibacter]MBS9715793.1 VWA domain-containing protein [Pseudohalocynthiibacter aestuariivivens]MCK0101406.1 VWA domain-containing protein [Pseudohalocynthiibacter sp. F2068]